MMRYKLNRDYRGMDRITDVCLFRNMRILKRLKTQFALGYCYIVGKALEQSREYGHSFKREVAF